MTGLMSYADCSFDSIGISPELASRFNPEVFAAGVRTFLDTDLDLKGSMKVAQMASAMPKLDFALDAKHPTINTVTRENAPQPSASSHR